MTPIIWACDRHSVCCLVQLDRLLVIYGLGICKVLILNPVTEPGCGRVSQDFFSISVHLLFFLVFKNFISIIIIVNIFALRNWLWTVSLRLSGCLVSIFPSLHDRFLSLPVLFRLWIEYLIRRLGFHLGRDCNRHRGRLLQGDGARPHLDYLTVMIRGHLVLLLVPSALFPTSGSGAQQRIHIVGALAAAFGKLSAGHWVNYRLELPHDFTLMHLKPEFC